MQYEPTQYMPPQLVPVLRTARSTAAIRSRVRASQQNYAACVSNCQNLPGAQRSTCIMQCQRGAGAYGTYHAGAAFGVSR
jgi:hypothetical protein